MKKSDYFTGKWVVFHIFFPCLCHLIFFPPLLLFDSIGVVRGCWKLLTFLFGASGGDIQNKSPPLEGMSLACDPWKWVVLMQHSHGSDKHIKLRKIRAHSAFSALTMKPHKAKGLWCILRVHVDLVQSWDRLEREERLFHVSNQHSCDHWVLHRQ